MWKSFFSQLKSLTMSQASVCAYSIRNNLPSKNRRADSSQNERNNREFEKHPSSHQRRSRSRVFQGNSSHRKKIDYSFLDKEDIDEEVDVYKYSHLKKLEEQDQIKHREFVKMKIIEKKYFSEENLSKKNLSWSDKEHIRYLQNTDPKKWTIEVLADQFKVDEAIIKKIAKANWLPKTPKVLEEKLEQSTVSLLSSENTDVSVKTHSKAQKQFQGNKKMSFKEFCLEGGTQVRNKSASVKPTPIEVNQEYSRPTHTETLLNYLRVEGYSKWASQNGDLNLRLDEDRAGNMNVYHYDNQHGYQHPFGKSGVKYEDESTPIVKEGEFHRRGDTFYDDDGEILFRVPGLSGNKS